MMNGNGASAPDPTASPLTAALASSAVVRMTSDAAETLIDAERAVLIVTRTACGYCASYQAEVERLIAQGSLADVTIGKIVIDEPSARQFGQENSWLPPLAALPYTVLYRRGRPVERFTAARGAFLRERADVALGNGDR